MDCRRSPSPFWDGGGLWRAFGRVEPGPLSWGTGRPQFLSSPGSAVAFVGCHAFAAMGTSVLTRPQAARIAARAVRGNFFVFRRRGGLCGPFVSVGFCSWSLLGRAIALWGHAAFVPGQFLVSGGAANFAGRSRPPDVFPVNPELRGRPLGSCHLVALGWLHWVGCTAYAVRGNFLSLRGSWSLWWRLGLPACGQFLLGGDAGQPLGAPMSPQFCVQAGFDPPAKLACWGTLVSGVGLGPGLHFRPVPRVCPGRHCTPFGGLARTLN